MMRNIPEFHWLDMAVLLCGAPVSIYNSSSADQVEYLVNHCGAVVAIVENQDFLAKFARGAGPADGTAHHRDRRRPARAPRRRGRPRS